MAAFFKYDGKFELNREKLKLLQTKLDTISKFSVTILTEISLSWQAFSGFSLCYSFKIVSLVTKLKEKDIFLFFIFYFIFMILGSFSYFLIAFKTGSEILRFSLISNKFLSILRFWFMLLKKVLKLLTSLWLFVMVLLLSFNIIVSLQNACFLTTYCLPKFPVIRNDLII